MTQIADKRAAPARSAASFAGVVPLVLKVFKSAKAVQLALVGASGAAYAALLSWEMAAVLVWGLVVHEYGHVWAMRRVGIPTRGFYLIPFVGGVALGGRAATRWQEVLVAAAGPAFGLLSLVPLAALAIVDGPERWLPALGFLALINLFNLLPIGFLDGGRILQAITWSVSRGAATIAFAAGILLGGAYLWYRGSALLAAILVLSWFEFRASRRRAGATPMGPHAVAVSVAIYVLLFGAFIAVIDLAAGVPAGDLPYRILFG